MFQEGNYKGNHSMIRVISVVSTIGINFGLLILGLRMLSDDPPSWLGLFLGLNPIIGGFVAYLVVRQNLEWYCYKNNFILRPISVIATYTGEVRKAPNTKSHMELFQASVTHRLNQTDYIVWIDIDKDLVKKYLKEEVNIVGTTKEILVQATKPNKLSMSDGSTSPEKLNQIYFKGLLVYLAVTFIF